MTVGVHIKYNEYLWCVDNNEGFRSPNMILESKFLNSELSFCFLMEGAHILHNDCLSCLDDNKGFKLSKLHWSQRSRSSLIKL